MSRNCQKCGGAVGADDIFCIHCGTLLERKQPEEFHGASGSGDAMQANAQDVPGMEKPLSVKEYLLIGILLSLPIVNIILAILWATGKKGNLNKRNLARAWLVFCAVGVVAGVIFLIGLVRAVQLDERNYPGYYEYYEDYWDEWDDWDDYYEYYDWVPEHENHWEDILEDWGEI